MGNHQHHAPHSCDFRIVEDKDVRDVQASLYQYKPPGLWFLLLYDNASNILHFRAFHTETPHFAPTLS